MRGKQDETDESVYDFFKRRMNEEVCMFSDFASLCFKGYTWRVIALRQNP